MRRTKIKKKRSFYVTRDSKGRIKKWTAIGKSLKADRRRKAKSKPKKRGRGHRGDY